MVRDTETIEGRTAGLETIECRHNNLVDNFYSKKVINNWEKSFKINKSYQIDLGDRSSTRE